MGIFFFLPISLDSTFFFILFKLFRNKFADNIKISNKAENKAQNEIPFAQLAYYKFLHFFLFAIQKSHQPSCVIYDHNYIQMLASRRRKNISVVNVVLIKMNRRKMNIDRFSFILLYFLKKQTTKGEMIITFNCNCALSVSLLVSVCDFDLSFHFPFILTFEIPSVCNYCDMHHIGCFLYSNFSTL